MNISENTNKSLVTNENLSKLLIPHLGTKTLLCWIRQGDQAHLAVHDEWAYESSSFVVTPCFTSEEIKRKLLAHHFDAIYDTEKDLFYWVEHKADLKPNELPVYHYYASEVECRAYYLLYLLQNGKS